jgi:2-hydroxy-6-oxonona-2,4-dienedioate hydrolase
MRSLIISAAVVAVVAGGGLYAWYRVDLAAAEQRIATGSAIADTSAGWTKYGDTGTGDPFLVIHGSGGGFDQGLCSAS